MRNTERDNKPNLNPIQFDILRALNLELKPLDLGYTSLPSGEIVLEFHQLHSRTTIEIDVDTLKEHLRFLVSNHLSRQVIVKNKQDIPFYLITLEGKEYLEKHPK